MDTNTNPIENQNEANTSAPAVEETATAEMTSAPEADEQPVTTLAPETEAKGNEARETAGDESQG